MAVYQALGIGGVVLVEITATTQGKAQDLVCRRLTGRWLEQWIEAGQRVRVKQPAHYR
jgi:hypothetical protein